MKRAIITITLFIYTTFPGYSQAKERAFYNHKLTIEPAVGTKLVTFAGGTLDIQPAVLVQYNLHPRLNFILHAATSLDIKTSHFKNVKTKHNYTSYQRIGIGTTLYSRKTANSFYLTGGAKHYMYSAKMNNKNLSETVEVDIDKWYPDWGLLYAFKWGKKRTFFCSRIYFPLFAEDMGYNLIENMTIEFGIGLRIM
ncbi:MAG: hypothetical protein LBV72_15145 [Tannerella sp.]|jgi:hypothetical protein|nr:hypothetical protein [Tannerella sp.]